MLRLILVPALITLGVTLLRLVGELNGWSRGFFNPDAGGGGAYVGIAWLVPAFGIYYGLKLANEGDTLRPVRVILYPLLALLTAFVLMNVLAFLFGIPLDAPSPGSIPIFAVASIVAIAITFRGAPSLTKVLLAYGLAARLPVVLIMLLAMLGNWGTHYDVAPTPDFPQMGVFAKWVLIGVVPQLTAWMAYTTIVGAFFGGLALAVARKKPTLQAA